MLGEGKKGGVLEVDAAGEVDDLELLVANVRSLDGARAGGVANVIREPREVQLSELEGDERGGRGGRRGPDEPWRVRW